MGDVIFVLIILAFFGLAWLLVKGCERIMGPALELLDDQDGQSDADVEPDVEQAA
jgi:hypothetical protein